MLNYNLTKNDIAYLRLLLAIQLCESKKNRRRRSVNQAAKYNLKYSANSEETGNSFGIENGNVRHGDQKI